MANVDIVNPVNGEKKSVTGATLGVWRRQGWVLDSGVSKTTLKKVRESKKETEAVSTELDQEA